MIICFVQEPRTSSPGFCFLRRNIDKSSSGKLPAVVAKGCATLITVSSQLSAAINSQIKKHKSNTRNTAYYNFCDEIEPEPKSVVSMLKKLRGVNS